MKKIFSFLMAALFSVGMFATTYTVAGGSADVFGTTWDPANTANDMTKLEDAGLFAGQTGKEESDEESEVLEVEESDTNQRRTFRKNAVS